MATIKLLIKGKSNPSSLYVRFRNGRSVDLFVPTGLFVNPLHWDNTSGNLRALGEIKNRRLLYAKYEKLKVFIFEQYNESYSLGEIIDSNWLKQAINLFLKRPKQEKNNQIKTHYVYYVKFAEWWLKEIAPTWRTEKNKTLNRRTIQQYESFISIFKKFQKTTNYKIIDLNASIITDFGDYMIDEEYSYLSTKRHVGRLKFFLNRAEKLSIKTNPNFKERIFVSNNDEEINVPFLDEEEINSIFELDLSHDESMDNIRDSFVIGLWTGLRISDFNHNLDVSNIKDGFVDIKTTKTGAWVTIPVHPHIRKILDKRFGNLPQRYSDKHFNEKVKIICMLSGIDNNIKGGISKLNKKTGETRKKVGIYPKYKLITSHTCRRSFATNLFGEVENHVIMSVGGWKTERMMLHYMKKTKRQHAEILKNHYDKKYN